MPTLSSPSILRLSAISMSLLSIIVGGVLVLLLFADYFRRKRADVAAITGSPELKTAEQKPDVKPPPSSFRKTHARSHHSRATDKHQNYKRHHPLDINTLRGHVDTITSLCFSSDGRNLATTCSDGIIRIFTLDDVSNRSFKLLKINLPAGAQPTAITFLEGAFSLVVAAQVLSGSCLYMYGDVILKAPGDGKQNAKVPAPEIKWEHHKIHEMRPVLTLVGVPSTYGSGDGSMIIASCSEGTDIKLWHGKSGKEWATVDTNQLKNNMAALSPNGRFLCAAAFTADVKVWEIIYAKDGSVKEVLKVMQLKGHKSAVTSLCFTPNSESVITASKDGTIRIWNINVRYHLDEDPKTLKLLNIPLKDAKGTSLLYDHISISPDGKILAVTCGPILQWLCAETGEVLDIADKSHEGDITGIAWAPQLIQMGNTQVAVLATASTDKKVKLWLAPGLQPS